MLAATRYHELGARAVAVTAGPDRLLLHDGVHTRYRPVPVNPDPRRRDGRRRLLHRHHHRPGRPSATLSRAAAYGAAAASLSVSGRGGTGRVPTFTETAALAGLRPGPDRGPGEKPPS
ncbi:hypothetical protein ABZ934_01320 [Streptomyces sp. NPDC046557]|uniref:hypothetical protein n=1 Tax=Streptomyces sp. NPDC046557 TaxID=3155372 RepID=UPI00341148A9